LAITQITEQELIEKAQQFQDRENWIAVISLLNPYHANGDLSINALKMLGYSYSRNKNYDEAIVIYQDLSQRQPNEAMWPYCLAYQYQCKKDFHSSIEAYLNCLQIFPKWIKVYGELAKLYKEIGEDEKALDTCSDGIQVYKNIKSDHQKKYASSYSKLCTLRARLISSKRTKSEADIAEIEIMLKESTHIDPQNADTWYRFGDFMIEQGKYDDAVQYLQKAESLAPQKEYIPHKIA